MKKTNKALKAWNNFTALCKQIASDLKEVYDRLRCSTPPNFWRKVRRACIGAGGVGILILSTPEYYPTWVVDHADELMVAGLIGTFLSSLTKSKPPEENSREETSFNPNEIDDE